VKKLFLLKRSPVNSRPVKKRHAAIVSKSPTGTRKHARYNVAVPVKVTTPGDPAAPVFACTYEVSREGCKLTNAPGLNTDQLVWLNRNNRKAIYKVVWASAQKNQVGLQVITSRSERPIWDDELVARL
jgi:hypothetical protein